MHIHYLSIAYLLARPAPPLSQRPGVVVGLLCLLVTVHLRL